MNKEEKAKLWSDRIQQYQTSGQTCKQWCAENGIPLSTMGYWIRRLAKEYDLKLSGGSDFHGSNKPHIKLGSGMGHLFVPYDLLTNLRPS